MFGQFDVNRWNFFTKNTTQPLATNFGTAVTPTTSNGAPSTWTEILSDASVTEDCYLMKLIINSHNTSATVRNLLVDIGIDTSGGTSYTTLIPQLIGGHAAGMGAAVGDGGLHYYFPLYIPAGSAIAARGRGSNASAISFYVAIELFGAPSHPHLIKYGTRVEAIGTDTSNSSGTTIVAGTTFDGTLTSLGTSTYDNFFWQVGYTATNSNQPSNSRMIDLAYDTDENMILQDILCISTTTEKISIFNRPDTYCFVPAGSTIYGRIQESASPVATQKMAAWGVS